MGSKSSGESTFPITKIPKLSLCFKILQPLELFASVRKHLGIYSMARFIRSSRRDTNGDSRKAGKRWCSVA
jgi:hypothetical protein